MFPPCVSVNEYLIPETRKRVAKNLKEKGMNEIDISKKLHISQGMVSRYIHQENDNYLHEYLNPLSNEISYKILENYNEKEITEFFCNSCIKLRESGKFCSIHKIKNCDLCFYLYNPEKNLAKNKIIIDLKSTAEELSTLKIGDLIPEVRINIAYAAENPKSIMDVTAFPGRLTYFQGNLISFKDPEFGASKHLSYILINSNRIDKNKRAVINIKYREDFVQILKGQAKNIKIMDRINYKEVQDYILNLKDNFDVIVDPGTFGIEPMIYVFAKNPHDLVDDVNIIIKGIGD